MPIWSMCSSASASTLPPMSRNSPQGCGSNTSRPIRFDPISTRARSRQERRSVTAYAAAALFTLGSLQTSSAYELTGRIISIADGDTVTLLDANLQQHKIRLSGIDAPERRQPFGNRSRLHLGALVFGKRVTADCPKTDRYKRAVCRIEVDGIDANLAQLEAGMAWHYKAYSREQSPADRWRYA